jgi:hypothetical protein
LVGDDRDGDGISGLYHVAGLRVGSRGDNAEA